jgi:hypothetical protein
MRICTLSIHEYRIPVNFQNLIPFPESKIPPSPAKINLKSAQGIPPPNPCLPAGRSPLVRGSNKPPSPLQGEGWGGVQPQVINRQTRYLLMTRDFSNKIGWETPRYAARRAFGRSLSLPPHCGASLSEEWGFCTDLPYAGRLTTRCRPTWC